MIGHFSCGTLELARYAFFHEKANIVKANVVPVDQQPSRMLPFAVLVSLQDSLQVGVRKVRRCYLFIDLGGNALRRQSRIQNAFAVTGTGDLGPLVCGIGICHV